VRPVAIQASVSKRGVIILKTKVCLATGPSLSTTKKFKNLKKYSLRIFKNSKNQNPNNLIIKEKNGGEQ